MKNRSERGTAIRHRFPAMASTFLLLSAAGANALAAPAQEPTDTRQDASGNAPSSTGGQVEEVVVTGFRASLNNALSVKRNETSMVDSIVAEDIGKFPDSNLAESMQRVPGVTIARGDSGEGRSISVRGLGAQFTRVRLNGMEGASQTGASDIYGAANGGRSFDFNAFPSEIFSSLAARKTASADVEEGSLGATIDLRAPRPFDYDQEQVISVTAKTLYNEVRESANPQFSFLGAKQFEGGRFGILGSLTHQTRNTREVGYSAVDILSANTNGLRLDASDPSSTQPFCTPIGYPQTSPSPTAQADKGATETMCSTGNPRTSTLEAYEAVHNARRADLPDVPGSGAYFPRIPRYSNSTQDQERTGVALTLQFLPDDRTDLSLDLLYSKYEAERRDAYIEAISFGRSVSNNGQPMTSIKDVQLSELGSVEYALFDGVDIRSEGLVNRFSTTYEQANLNFKRTLSDAFELSGLVGVNRSTLDGKEAFRYYMDAIDTPDFMIDFRDGGSTPLLGFGFDVSDPNQFQYAPSDNGNVYGGIDFRGEPRQQQTEGSKAEVNLDWTVNDAFTAKFGGQFRRSDYRTRSTRYYPEDQQTQPLPDGVSISDITMQIRGLDSLWGRNAPSSWVALDPDKLRAAFDLDNARSCGVECGAGRDRVREDVIGGYLMGVFDLASRLPVPVRGDVGIRYVDTDQYTSAYITVSDSSSPTGVTGQFASVSRSYENWLPSTNIVIEPREDLLIRFAAAKVMSRPELGVLVPSSGVNPITRTGNVRNPFLDPIEATTFDTSVEWYFRPGSLLSFAYFYKDISTYIQSVNSQVPFNQLGLPNALLDGTNTQPTEIFTVSQPFNTPGGPLKGFELNAQLPFTFLDGFWSSFGVLANYTHVTSKIDYILASQNGVPTATTTADLVGLSKNTASGTIYYEDGRFSIRSTMNYRDNYVRGIPASPGSDLQGNDDTLYVDASASYAINDNLRLTFDAQNLTDEQNRLYVDSTRQDTLFETRVGRTYTLGLTYRYE